MHFLLKSALRSLSDNSQRARAVPWVDTFFPCKYWMPPRRFVQFVHTVSSQQGHCSDRVCSPGNSLVQGKPWQGGKGNLSQNCCQSRHVQNLPRLAPLPPKGTIIPSQQITQPYLCHTCFTPAISNCTRR